MKEVIRYALILMFVCTIAAVSLTYTYSKTKPLIDEQAEKIAEKTKKEVLPDIYSFKEFTRDKQIFYIGYDEKDSQVGVVVKIETRGYSDTIEMMVGVKNDGTVSGVRVLTHKETPGLGENITKEDFMTQFIGKTSKGSALKKDSADGKIDAITAATISSRAVSDGVRKAIELIENIESKEKE